MKETIQTYELSMTSGKGKKKGTTLGTTAAMAGYNLDRVPYILCHAFLTSFFGVPVVLEFIFCL